VGYQPATECYIIVTQTLVVYFLCPLSALGHQVNISGIPIWMLQLSWTTIVAHSRDVEDCGGTPRRKSTLKSVKIPNITIWQYWLGNTKPKKAFRLILNTFKKFLQNFKKKINGIFYLLTDCQIRATQKWLRLQA